MKNLKTKFDKKAQRFKGSFKTRFFIDSNPDYTNSIFLAGVARSGTTWMSDVINHNNEYRYIFEPFYPEKVSICSEFIDKQYIRLSNDDPKFLKPTKAILAGKVRSEWSDRFNQRVISEKRLIKSIRANLFLKWLNINFPNIPIVLLLRHPCAVANSKIKLNWRRSLDKYIKQEELMEDYLRPFKKEIEDSEKAYKNGGNCFDNHIFIWCIENYVPLKQFKLNEIHIVFYEQLCLNPETEVSKMFCYLDKKYDETITNAFQKASKLSGRHSSIFTGDNLTDSWKMHITEEQIQRANEILTIFGLDKIYSLDSMPHIENLPQFMKS